MQINKRVTADYEVTKTVHEINAIKRNLKKSLLDSGFAIIECNVVWKELIEKIK